jgi:hypothetical protein
VGTLRVIPIVGRHCEVERHVSDHP